MVSKIIVFLGFENASLSCRRLASALLVTGLLLLGVRAGNAQTTQQLSLTEGWNLVSLNVQPQDPSFDVVFGANANEIFIVKDEKGRAYIPSAGIEEITAWETEEGYLIYSKAAVDLDVSGTSISPESNTVRLNEGWNLIPYLLETPQAVEQALASISETLLLAEDSQGNVYKSDGSIAELDSLRPGKGYKVYLNGPDTLTYSGESASPDHTIEVNTLADALALRGVEPGQHIQMLGYHEPGDGGGGLFEVKENACRTDGGTCFVFDEDVSAEQSSQTSSNLDSPHQLPHSDLIWSSLRVEYGTHTEDVAGIDLMHGHSGHVGNPHWIDTKDGTIFGAFKQIRYNTTDRPKDFVIRYRYATSDRRLVREGVTNSVNVAWWGARPVSEGYGGREDDQTAEINWAVTTADRLRQEKGLDTFYVDVPDMYYKLYRTFIFEDVILRGTGPERTFGDGTMVRGGFRMPPGEALWWIRSDYEQFSHPWHALGANRFGLSNFYYHGESGTKPDRVGMEHIDIDGNLPNNMEPFTAPTASEYDNVDNALQNAGGWPGWERQAFDKYPPGMKLILDNVAIRNVGGNSLNNSSSKIDLTYTNSFVGSSLRNHLIYGLTGTIQDVVYEGTGWGALLKVGSWADWVTTPNDPNERSRAGATAQWGSTYKNLTVRNTEVNDYYNWPGAVMDVERSHVTVDGFMFDLRGMEAITAMKGLAIGEPGFKMRNGTIYTPDDGVSLFEFIDPRSKYPRTFDTATEVTEFENIHFYDGGGGITLTSPFKEMNTNFIFKDITIEALGVSGVGDAVAAGTIVGADMTALPVPLPGAKRVEYDNVNWQRPSNHLALFTWPDGATYFPQDFFIKGSSVENVGDWSVWYRNSDEEQKSGRLDRVYLHGTTFNVPTDLTEDTFHKQIGEGIVRVRNSQDRNGRISDSVGNTFTSSAASEGNDYVLIPTNLFSRPGEIDATLTSSPTGITTITSVEVANRDGTLRPDTEPNEHDPYLKVNLDGTIGAGEMVTVSWDAHVTPLDAYSSTGVFISRPIEDKSYAAGGGPFIIDLRGVAASHESRTAIDYSATSSNSGVVQANVSASDHRGTNRYYTLGLTPQGTGTATITVTGEISGVGTATTTFTVNVE